MLYVNYFQKLNLVLVMFYLCKIDTVKSHLNVKSYDHCNGTFVAPWSSGCGRRLIGDNIFKATICFMDVR